MISNKTLATLFLITSSITTVASGSSSGTQGPSSSIKLNPKKRYGPALNTREVLADADNTVNDVGVQEESTGMVSTLQELSVPQVDNQFKRLIEQRKYNDVVRLAVMMNMEEGEFLKQLRLVVKAEQYKGFVKFLGGCTMVASFYVYGDIGVAKEAIVKSVVYGGGIDYVKNGDLETALLIAFNKEYHNRFVELLGVRKGIIVEDDEERKQRGWLTSFEHFVNDFIRFLTPWEDGVALRRFLILRGEELRNKDPDILDTICREVVISLSIRLDFPEPERLLVDLIGLPSLLTPVTFAGGFLSYHSNMDCSTFIKYGWRETIEEGLKGEYEKGGTNLWRVMTSEFPEKFSGEFPVTEEALAAVLKHFPTKQQTEEEWYKKCLMMFFNKPNNKSISHIFPDVLWSIIFGYAVSLIFTEDSTVSAK